MMPTADAFTAACWQGTVEMLGAEWTAQLLQAAPADFGAYWSAFSRALPAAVGERSAQGMAVRIGEAAFGAFIQQQAAQLGMAGLAFRLQPVLRRIRQGLDAVCRAVQEQAGMDAACAELPDAYQVTGSGSLLGWLLAGFFQAYLEWASNGKVFLFSISRPDADRWEIRYPKTPFDH
ncbi:MAG: hypothetical protein HPY85_11685 [Anaerolineae bacterium]|nr:hypothetical protein [Anaerolineae bacterium]